MKESLYDALREANVSESLAMKTANDIPDDIATRAELKLAAAESENRSERALSSFEMSNAKALASFETSNAKAIAALRMTIAESEKKYEKAMAALAWKIIGSQTAFFAVIVAVLRLL